MDSLKRHGVDYRPGEELACMASKSAVDTYAESIAAQIDFRAGASVEEVISRLGGRIAYEESMLWVEQDATILVHAPEDFDIAMTAYGNPRRDRFTLAHEVGHYLLHSEQGKHPMQADRKGSNRAEWEANWFAAGFLMPKSEFVQLVQEGHGSRHIANYFRVSEPAVQIRRKSLGLASDD